MKLVTKIILFAGLFSALAYGCFPAKTLHAYEVLKPINEADISKLQRGQTTKDAATGIFGSPYNRIRTEAGETYIYKYFGDSLAIAFDNNNRLSTFTYQPEPFRLLTETPSRTYGNFSSSFLRRLEPGVDRFSKLQQRIGLPTRTENGTERQKLIYRGRNQDLIAWITMVDSVFIQYELKDR